MVVNQHWADSSLNLIKCVSRFSSCWAIPVCFHVSSLVAAWQTLRYDTHINCSIFFKFRLQIADYSAKKSPMDIAEFFNFFLLLIYNLNSFVERLDSRRRLIIWYDPLTNWSCRSQSILIVSFCKVICKIQIARWKTNASLTSVLVSSIFLVASLRSTIHWSKFLNFTFKILSSVIHFASIPLPINFSQIKSHKALSSHSWLVVISFPTKYKCNDRFIEMSHQEAVRLLLLLFGNRWI